MLFTCTGFSRRDHHDINLQQKARKQKKRKEERKQLAVPVWRVLEQEEQMSRHCSRSQVKYASVSKLNSSVMKQPSGNTSVAQL